MNKINLIPAPRRAAKRRRVHLRRCVAGCAAWAILSLAVAIGSRAVWRGEDPQSGERLARVNEDVNRAEHGVADARAQLAKAQSGLRANQAIAAQPDWSILLALLGKQVENDVVLKNAHVRPGNAVRGSPAAASAARPEARRAAPRQPGDAQAGTSTPAPLVETIPYVLEASGLAQDYPAANNFVLRLEATGLFSKVTLIDTARESFLEKNKVAFRLECSLDQSPVPDDVLGAKATATAAAPPNAARKARPTGRSVTPGKSVAPGGAAASGRD